MCFYEGIMTSHSESNERLLIHLDTLFQVLMNADITHEVAMLEC